jgi:superfamily II DNA/RNA helicase
MLYSATFSPPVRKAAAKYLRPTAAMVTVGAARAQAAVFGAKGSSSLASSAFAGTQAGSGSAGAINGGGGVAAALVAQAVVAVPAGGDRNHKLGGLLLGVGSSEGLLAAGERTIVFVETKRDAAWLARQLNGLARFGGSGTLAPADDGDAAAAPDGADPSAGPAGGGGSARAVKVVGGARAGDGVAELHGDLTQAQRDAQLGRFRAGAASVLVCTDVASRGLDVPNVDHVVRAQTESEKELIYVESACAYFRSSRSRAPLNLSLLL